MDTEKLLKRRTVKQVINKEESEQKKVKNNSNSETVNEQNEMACAGVKRVLDDNTNSDDESVCGKRSRSSSLSLDEYTDSDDTATNADEEENINGVWIEAEAYGKLMDELEEFRARAAADETLKKTKSVQDQLNTLGINAKVKTLVGNRFAALDEEVNNNDVDFPALEKPKQKKPKKAAKSKATPQLINEIEEMDVDQPKTTKRTTDPKSLTPTKPIKETGTATTTQPKSSKKRDIPIIATYNVNPKELTGMLRQIVNEHFTLNIINKNRTQIKVFSLEDFLKTKQMLDCKKIHYFSYTPKELKPLTLILKKLPQQIFSKEEVKMAIQENCPEVKILTVKEFKKSFWLVQIEKSSQPSPLLKINTLLNCKVKFEAFKKSKSSITQCHNCQRFGHVASNCKMQYRCIKCTAVHAPGKCSILKTDPPSDSTKTQCVNCKGQHTANAKICPIRIQVSEKLSQKRKTSEQKTTRVVSKAKSVAYKKVDSNIPFASLFKNTEQKRTNPSQEPPQLPQNVVISNPALRNHMAKKLAPKPQLQPQTSITLEDLNKDSSEIFGKDLFSCINIMQNLIKKYPTKGLQTKEDATKMKHALLLDFFIQIAQNK